MKAASRPTPAPKSGWGATELEFQEQVFNGRGRSYVSLILGKVEHKGPQYSGRLSDPALQNFKEPAENIIGLPPPLYLMTQATKQWYVISQWAKHGPSAKTAIAREVVDRILDVIVYMLLLLFMLERVYGVNPFGEEKKEIKR